MGVDGSAGVAPRADVCQLVRAWPSDATFIGTLVSLPFVPWRFVVPLYQEHNHWGTAFFPKNTAPFAVPNIDACIGLAVLPIVGQ